MTPQVVVVGCGIVGLPLAAALASVGCAVLGVDTDQDRIDQLSQGRCEPAEEGLTAALQLALDRGTIAFAATIAPARQRRVFMVAVPTPASAACGFDRGPLDCAMAMITAVAQEGDLVCIRSTVPIGTTRRLSAAPAAGRLLFAACPDRSVSGCTFSEQFATPHLVGGLDAAAGDRAAELFAGLAPVVRVGDPETAEAIKLFANVSRDVSFAMANQFALICEATGIDMTEVRAAGTEGYPRFQPARPGPVGGPCMTKDVHLLAASEAAAGLNVDMLLAARALNDGLAVRLAREIVLGLDATGGSVAILGMAFKGVPATSETRGAFGGELAQALRSTRPDLEIRTWDPVAQPNAAARRAAVRGAAVVVLANDHADLAACLDELPRLAPGALIYDLAGALPPNVGGPGIRVKRFGDGGAAR